MPMSGHRQTPTNREGASDDLLIQQVQAGHREALAELFRRHARAVRSIGIRILKDEAEAEDLVQEVFLFVFRRAHLFQPKNGTGASWIIHLSYHRAIDRRRSLKSRGFYSDHHLDEAISSNSGVRETSPHCDALEEILGRGSLARIYAELTPEQRETIHLFFFEGYTLKEIAQHQGRKVMNVRSYFYRGLERMRRSLAVRSRAGEQPAKVPQFEPW